MAEYSKAGAVRRLANNEIIGQTVIRRHGWWDNLARDFAEQLNLFPQGGNGEADTDLVPPDLAEGIRDGTVQFEIT